MGPFHTAPGEDGCCLAIACFSMSLLCPVRIPFTPQ